MNATSATTNCPAHGDQDTTFVCQHIAQGLRDKKKVGFYWAGNTDEERPDAWCSDCEKRRQANGGEWSVDCNSFLGAKILCALCYDYARKINLEDDKKSGWKWWKK